MTTSSTSSTSSTSTTSYLTSNQQSQSQVSGLVSGLDTQTLISQLMQAAAIPQTQLKNKVTSDNAMLTDMQNIQTKLQALQTASEALSQSSGWGLTTATSNDTSVTASSSGATAGTVSFDVLHIAKAQSLISNDTYTSTGASVAGGPLSYTDANGKTTSIKVGDGSLSQVVSGINSAGLGITAQAVKVDATHYRLQVTSSSTGSAGAFTLTGITDDTAQLSPAQDAEIALGGNSNYTVKSSTNTFTGLANGLTVTVSKENVTGVNVSVGADTAGLTKNIQTMVDAANAALTEISNDTAYDTSTQTGSPLTGNSTVRDITNQILASVSSSAGGKSLAAVGLSVTADGQLSFDSTTFLAKYNADPAGTQQVFTSVTQVKGLPSGLAGGVAVRRTSSTTADGTYAIHVTQAATKSSTTLDTSSLTAGQVLTFSRGGSTATYTVTGSETPATLAAAITAATQAKGINLTAKDDGSGSLQISSSGYGSISNFAFSVGGTAQTVSKGLDVAGTIGGRAAIGNGQILAAPDLSPPLGGLSLTVSLTAADLAAGGANSSVSIAGGAAQALANLSATTTDIKSGSLTADMNGIKSEVSDLQTRITDWNSRLAQQQQALETQYANLESMLSSLKTQSSSLTAALAGLTSSSSSG